MIELVQAAPVLFLDGIRERLYNSTGNLVSVETIHKNLVDKLHIALKKAGTLNAQKCLVKKYKSTVCGQDLLQTFAQLECGRPSARYINKQNMQCVAGYFYRKS
ncbi:hypothetical protein PSTG_16986 [Puccinia striiformis f. sp. tritici PST-78]|uniref:Uncharacterized protein n=1 Tax=Puccinia striiformis f. sp. tritici PST-78 TaxID=1165861 RepID=A0A0L0URG0_9BASI|nr:hypothetical protein PSTG_16986 [Puccinia striiformis f. sp. tritici PST-78]